MTRYLLDTNILSNLLRFPNGSGAQHIARVGSSACCTSLIVAAELRAGALKRGSKRLSDLVNGLLQKIDVLPLEPPAEHHYADIRYTLEHAGETIGANDLWIAAHARVLDATLVTANEREFRRVQGLRVENWLS